MEEGAWQRACSTGDTVGFVLPGESAFPWALPSLATPVPHGEAPRPYRAQAASWGNGSGDRWGPTAEPSPGRGAAARTPASPGPPRPGAGGAAEGGTGRRHRRGGGGEEGNKTRRPPSPTARYLLVVPRQDPLHGLGATAAAPLHGLQHRAQLHARRPLRSAPLRRQQPPPRRALTPYPA